MAAYKTIQIIKTFENLHRRVSLGLSAASPLSTPELIYKLISDKMDGYMSKLQKAMVGDRPNQQPVKEQSDLESHLRMLQILKRIEDEYGTIDIPNMISVLQTVQDYREKQARIMSHQTMLQKKYYEQMAELIGLSQQRQQAQQLLESTSPKQIVQSQDHKRNGVVPAAGRMGAFTPVPQHFMPQNPGQHNTLQQQERMNDTSKTRNMDLLSLVSEKLSSLQNEDNAEKRRDDNARPSFLSGPVKESQGYKNPVEQKLADSVLAGAYENRVDQSLINKETSAPPAFDILRDRLVREYGSPIERVEKRMTNSSYLVRFNVTAEMASKLLPPIPKHVEEMKKSNEFKSVFKHDVILVDVFGRNHNVKYEGIVSSRQRHNRLTTGWCSAARSIGLDVGDKIIFERWTEDRRIIHILVEKDPEFASDDSSSRKRARC
ncbi:hypothetical protein M9435_002831 [Picochlorum sp. BPE23]|nr:hypothetical protein M9435_002831 [Picochlorum sp. BPE23]